MDYIAHQAPLSSTVSQSLLKLMSTESVMQSNHLILCHLLLLLPPIFPSIRVFSDKSALCIKCQSIGASVSASVLPINIQVLFPLGLTGLISFQSKLQESSPVPQFKSISSPHLAFLMVQFLHPSMTTGKTIALTVWIFVGKDADIICLCFFICCLVLS